MKRKIGYNVYHAPDGDSESYLGFVTSLRAARTLAAHGAELPRSLYDTAAKATACGPRINQGRQRNLRHGLAGADGTAPSRCTPLM